MNEQCLFSCVWNMAICITDKSLFRDPGSICKLPCANATRSFTWEVDGSSLVSVPLPVCSTVFHGSPKPHANPTEWERQIRQIWYEKSTMEGMCLKCDGKSEVSRGQGTELWKEQENQLLEIVSTVTGTSQNFNHRQIQGISYAFYRYCLCDCGHEVDNVLSDML